MKSKATIYKKFTATILAFVFMLHFALPPVFAITDDQTKANEVISLIDALPDTYSGINLIKNSARNLIILIILPPFRLTKLLPITSSTL